MKKTILVLGIACAATLAMAQSDARQDQTGQANGAATQRDQATGLASGKRMHKPMPMKTQDASAQGVVSPRDVATGQASGREGIVHRDLATRNAADAQEAVQSEVHSARETGSGMATGRMSATHSNPMYKDSGVSGNNPLYQGSSRATKSRSNVQNNRVVTGDVDGDGAAEAVVVKSKSNITNNRVAVGDVNGDGTPGTAVSPSQPAQMKGDYSRGHQPDRKLPDTTNGKNAREAGSGIATGKRQ
ncbi:MAG: hypothetical protein ACM3JB_05780 [Acidobacteriaceae bacterium]